MRALVTGISGFAGSHLVEHLLASGDQVRGVVRGESQLAPQIAHVPVTNWDLRQPVATDTLRAIDEFAPDCVYHLAALSVPRLCGDREPTADAWAANVDGTRHVIALCQALSHTPRLMYVSSSKVYTRDTNAPTKVDEMAPLDPATGYGRTKLAAEQLVQQAAAEGLDAVIVRAFQHAGPRQSAHLMLGEWAQQFACTQQPVQVQCLSAYLDLTDVRDVVRAYRLLIEHAVRGQVYNVGSGRHIRSGDVFAELRCLADPHRPVVEASSKPRYEPLADITRLQNSTGWRPTIDWRQTVADTWHYWSKPAHQRTAIRSEA